MTKIITGEKIHSLSNEDVKRYIPHRYPFLMVDYIEDLVLFERATGVKNVSSNEPFFQGHFPGQPVFPGVLMVEALAQTASASVYYSLEQTKKKRWKHAFLAAADKVRFRHIVKPGDQLLLQVKQQFNRRQIWRYTGTVMIKQSGNEAAVAEFTAVLSDDD